MHRTVILTYLTHNDLFLARIIVCAERDDNGYEKEPFIAFVKNGIVSVYNQNTREIIPAEFHNTFPSFYFDFAICDLGPIGKKLGTLFIHDNKLYCTVYKSHRKIIIAQQIFDDSDEEVFKEFNITDFVERIKIVSI